MSNPYRRASTLLATTAVLSTVAMVSGQLAHGHVFGLAFPLPDQGVAGAWIVSGLATIVAGITGFGFITDWEFRPEFLRRIFP